MCRNIKTLYNFDPPAAHDEIHLAAIQHVRKISGFNEPSAANEAAFNRAIAEVEKSSARLLDSLVTSGSPRNRELDAARSRARAVRRFVSGLGGRT